VVSDELRTVIRILKQDLLVESKVAEWSREKSSDGSLGDRAVAARLEELEPALADAYRQVLMDPQDDQRFSYRGPGNELRELLREILDLLAPDAKVKSEQWFRDSRASGPNDKRDRPPTQAEKARYIARSRGLVTRPPIPFRRRRPRSRSGLEPSFGPYTRELILPLTSSENAAR
jgi:hypothetical protein